MGGKLIMTKGLPGSGKSTWAEGFQKDVPFTVVVTKDDIRAELNRKDWNYDVEKEVLRIRDKRISEALSKGLTVISADTNLARKHEHRLRELAKKYKATFEVNDTFLQVPIEVCIERDAAREDKIKVGERVIRKMHDTYLLANPEIQLKNVGIPDVVAYVPDTTKPKAIIVDLDGTLAIHNGRSPYDTAKCETDLLNEVVADIVHAYFAKFYTILYVSGRDEEFREQSTKWVQAVNLPTGSLYMRPKGDRRNDAIVKAELFDAHIRKNFNVRFVLDDRDRVVKMWRGLGLTCLQVAEGAF